MGTCSWARKGILSVDEGLVFRRRTRRYHGLYQQSDGQAKSCRRIGDCCLHSLLSNLGQFALPKLRCSWAMALAFATRLGISPASLRTDPRRLQHPLRALRTLWTTWMMESGRSVTMRKCSCLQQVRGPKSHTRCQSQVTPQTSADGGCMHPKRFGYTKMTEASACPQANQAPTHPGPSAPSIDRLCGALLNIGV